MEFNFLDLLLYRFPYSSKAMLFFYNEVYRALFSIFDKDPAFCTSWAESLGDFNRYMYRHRLIDSTINCEVLKKWYQLPLTNLFSLRYYLIRHYVAGLLLYQGSHHCDPILPCIAFVSISYTAKRMERDER